MAQKRFQISIIGPAPDEVSLSDLADIIRQIEAAVLAYAKARDLKFPEDKPAISLVDVVESSEGLVFSAPEPVIPAIASISKAIHDSKFEDIPPESYEALYKTSELVTRRGWGFKFKEDSALDIWPAVVTSEEPLAPVPAPEISGTTTVLARCLRVGGVQPKAELRISNSNDLLFVKVTEQIARDLGKRLYDEVVLDGKATWRTDNWKIRRFEVSSVSEFRKIDPCLAFKELASAAGGQWDDEDAVEYVRKVRGDN